MTFSATLAKESFKTALALTLAYGISLGMGWENPSWAGFGVAMISMSTVGQSLNKGAMRMLGTLAAAAVALALIAAFAQDRWWFIAVLSVYLGACIYMVTGKRYQYFWWCCAFVVLVICTQAAGDIEDPFPVAVLRAQQTGLGILVYSLVSVLLWPNSTKEDLHAAARDLAGIQAKLFRAYRDLAEGDGTAEASRPLRLQEVQLVARLAEALRGAETDSYEVAEMRRRWWQLHADCTAIMETLEHWRQSVPEIQPLGRHRLAPNLESAYEEIGARLAEIERMLAGDAPARAPEPVVLALDAAAVRELGHFEQAAVAVAKSSLERLQALTRSAFECARDLSGHGEQGPIAPSDDLAGAVPAVPRPAALALDPDRLLGAAKTVASVWIAFAVWVYVDPPGHSVFVQVTVMFFMMSLMMRLDPMTMVKPMLVGAVVAGILYVFVMPKLSGYTQLGALIFVTTFAICFFLGEPRQALAKTFLIVMFMIVTGIQNEQTYSFAGYANTVASFALGVGGLVIAIYYLPPSPRPEKVFLRLLARFFRHCDYLLSRLAPDRGRGARRLQRWAALFYQADLLELPSKLADCGARIDHRAFPDNDQERVQALVCSLHAIALRVKALGEARDLPHAQTLVRELSDELRAWREVAQEHVRRWADDPSAAADPSAELERRLTARLARLEQRVEETFGSIGEGELRHEDYENLYRYLGSFRGMSEASLGYARLAETVNWRQWREERFT